MSKYNLTDILKEFVGGGRIGTLKISYRDLVDKMDQLEQSGKAVVREIPGPSGDGKSNREFEVVTNRSAVPGGRKQEKGFTVYDYKFGFDPGSMDHFEEEYDFSVGGNDLDFAMELIPDIVPYRLEEEKSKKVNEGDLFSSEFDRQELKAIINDLNEQPIFDMSVRRAYKFLVSLLDKEDKEELGVNEQMYIDDDEFNKEMGRSKKDALKKEMAFHVDQLLDGNIDKNDFMNVVEDIMAELNLREEVEIPGSVLNKIAASVSNPATGAKAMLDFYKQIQDKENIDLATNAKFKMAIDKLRDLADDKEMDEVMGIDRKGNKKDDTKDTMLSKARMTMKESSQEESLADYLIKSYTNPKTGKSLVDDRMISDFMKTVPEWEDIFDGSEEGNDSIDKEFEEFLFLNYDSIDEVKDKKEMKQLKEHFNRFK